MDAGVFGGIQVRSSVSERRLRRRPRAPGSDSAALERRPRHVETDEVHQRLVRQLREIDLSVAGQDVVRELPLLRDHLVDASDGMRAVRVEDPSAQHTSSHGLRPAPRMEGHVRAIPEPWCHVVAVWSGVMRVHYESNSDSFNTMAVTDFLRRRLATSRSRRRGGRFVRGPARAKVHALSPRR